ncbi:MAG: hypothetical protein FWG34_13730 [Oscillospiraceae bacterium]|nr:hypothetical protein [Oscillospiraceae bacterium]
MHKHFWNVYKFWNILHKFGFELHKFGFRELFWYRQIDTEIKIACRN